MGIDRSDWRRIVTFGSEGTESGKFCRPWGVAIVRHSDLPSFSEQQVSTTSNISPGTFGEWSNNLCFNDDLFNNDKSALNSTVGSNNNQTNSTSKSPPWSIYLIAIADRSNNRIQLYNFDAIKQTVTFLHMFGDGPGARHGQFDRPAGIVFNPKLEQIIVADKDNHRVQVFDMSGSYLFKFGERGNKCGQFCYPWDIDVCKTTHNIIVSDTRNRRVQMFNNLGRYVTHFSQPLDSPRGLVFLSPNQIIVSDFNKHRLLMITQSMKDKFSSPSSVVNPGPISPNPIGFATPTTHRPNQHAIQPISDFNFVGFGEGSSWGEFLRPQGVSAHGNKIFCSDSRNNRVACWNKETQSFNYIGKEVVELDRPAGLAAIDNYLVIVDFGNNRVQILRRLTPFDGYTFETAVQSRADHSEWRCVATFGSEGTEPGKFCRPWGVAIVRYSDLSNFNEQEISTTSTTSSETFGEWSNNLGLNDDLFEKGAVSSTVGSNNNRASSTTSPPWSTYLIGIADRSNNRIQLFNFDAIRQTVTFLHMFGDGPGARHGQFDRPAGLVFNPKLGQIIVADKDNHRVQVFDMSGSYLFKFGERGNKCGQFCYPWDIDVCKTTHNIIVSDTRNRRVQMFNNLGRYVTHFSQPLDSPRGLVFLSPNQIIVSDFNKHRLLTMTQLIEDNFSSLSTTATLTPMSNHDMTFATSTSHRPSNLQHVIQKMHDFNFVGFGEGSSWGEFLRPQGVTAHGNKIFCSDSRNNRIACWNKETQSFSYIGKEVVELDRPAGLAAIDNYLVIVDFGSNRVHICQRFMPLDGYNEYGYMKF